MGYLKDIHSNLDIQAFPGAHFEIAGEAPLTQCSEAKIEGDHAFLVIAPPQLKDVGAFVSYDLTGKVCTVVSGPFAIPGDYDILSNTDDALTLATSPGDSPEVVYYVHDGGSLILTRNIASFAKFIHAAGHAYTIKGGKLYTDMPSAQLKNACTILFDPLT